MSAINKTSSVSPILEKIRELDKDPRNMGVLQALVREYLVSNPNSNLATLESWLREQGCRLRLIAEKADPKHPLYPPLSPRTFTKTCPYNLFFSNRDPEVSKKEMEDRAGDQKTNLERLTQTGLYVFKDGQQLRKALSVVPQKDVPISLIFEG
jgi:hypothetical protein